MANLYCGDNGDDAKDGKTWPNRTETITGMLGKARSAGDRLYVGPGVYRTESRPGISGTVVELNGSGAKVTSAGSIAVTEGGKIVTGTGTSWDPAVHVGDGLFIGPDMSIQFEAGDSGEIEGASGIRDGTQFPLSKRS